MQIVVIKSDPNERRRRRLVSCLPENQGRSTDLWSPVAHRPSPVWAWPTTLVSDCWLPWLAICSTNHLHLHLRPGQDPGPRICICIWSRVNGIRQTIDSLPLGSCSVNKFLMHTFGGNRVPGIGSAPIPQFGINNCFCLILQQGHLLEEQEFKAYSRLRVGSINYIFTKKWVFGSDCHSCLSFMSVIHSHSFIMQIVLLFFMSYLMQEPLFFIGNTGYLIHKEYNYNQGQ